MYSSRVKEYEIDLSLPERERWWEVIEAEGDMARELAEEALGSVDPSSLKLRALGGLFSGLYAVSGGRFRDEMKSWSQALGVSTGSVYLVNCAYELSHLAERAAQSTLFSRVFGCTAGARWVRGLGMVHARSMDWPIPGIGPATRLFRFVNGSQEFVSVGVPGFVGVLSGMVPGAYSVTINWAPPVERPSFDWGPAFLLREVLAECETYDEAVNALSESRLSTAVFFLVCGVRKNEACVIERTRKYAVIRPVEGGLVVQGNHHVAEDFADNNDLIDQHDPDSLFACSAERVSLLGQRLSRVLAADSLARVRKALCVFPVQNEDSVQQMVFCPKTGQVSVWKKTA